MFQPANVKPVLVPAVVERVSGVPAVITAVELVVPPLALYVSVYVLAVHFAYKIIETVGLYEALSK